MLSDRKMNVKIKWKEYRTVVRPAQVQGQRLEKAQEKKLEVAEMYVLGWMCGATMLDRIRNEIVRGITKVW